MSARRRTRVGMLALMLVALLVAAPCFGDTTPVPITPTERLYNPDGTLAGFRSNEPGLYFLIPSDWRIADLPNAVALVDVGQGQHDLRLTLSPSYTNDVPLVNVLRAAEPGALFFPLPAQLEEVSLFLPPALGTAMARLAPEPGGTPIAVYYRLRLDDTGLAALRQLARGGLALQGAITYDFPVSGVAQRTTAPLTVQLPPGALDTISSAPAPSPTAWLDDLLRSTELDAPGALDGIYPLGSGISVTLEHTRVRGSLRPGSYRLAQTGGSIALTPTAQEDLAGTVDVHVRELGLDLRVAYDAGLASTLDLLTMRLRVDALAIHHAAIDGHASPFYAALLDNLAKDPQLQSKLSSELTRELQVRILSKTLFGISQVP